MSETHPGGGKIIPYGDKILSPYGDKEMSGRSINQCPADGRSANPARLTGSPLTLVGPASTLFMKRAGPELDPADGRSANPARLTGSPRTRPG